MKTLTKKHRREIYLKAAERIHGLNSDDCFMCDILSNKARIEKEDLFEVFPEFRLLRRGKFNERDVWFGGEELTHPCKTNRIRILILLLCAEMCND